MTRDACEHCPLDGTGKTCPRWPSDHRRYCEWVDPASPGFKPGGAVALVAMANNTPVPTPPRAFPPLKVQARNLAGAVGRFVASGMELASDEEKARRAAICGGCEHFAGGRCSKCGCWLNYKQSLASEHCPDAPPRW